MTISYGNSANTIMLSRYLTNVSNKLNKSLERLSTGLKINHASDGAAQLQLSDYMTSQIRGYDVAASNAQEGLNMLETADSALQQISMHLQDIRDIAVAASNGTTTTSQFSAYQADLQAKIASIDSIATNTKYGANVLLNGSLSGGTALNIQIGANSGDTLDIKTAFTDNKANSGLRITQNTLTTNANATTLLGQVDAAISTLNSHLGTIGGFENRLTDQISYLSIAKTNVAAAQSSIMDTDVAAETAAVTRLQILQQAGAYALAQANIQPQIALRLLPG